MTFQWLGLLVVLAVIPLLVAIYAGASAPAPERRPLFEPRPDPLGAAGLVAAPAPPPFALLASAVAVMVVALARPSVVLSIPTNQTTIIPHDRRVGLDVLDRHRPDPDQAAEDAAITFVKSQKAETQIGIVAFSGFAAVVQPPTTNQDDLVSAIKSLTTGRRTAIGSGILAAIDAISEVDPTVQRSVIPAARASSRRPWRRAPTRPTSSSC